MALRGSNITSSNTATSLNISLPAGSAAGDLALIFSGGYQCNVPAGWTTLFNYAPGIWNSMGCWKVLSSGDISAGFITVTQSFSIDMVVAIAVFVSSGGGVREDQSSQQTGPATYPLTTSGAVLNTDTAIYWCSERTGTTTITPSSGSATSLQTASTTGVGSNSELASQAMPGGAFTVDYSPSGAAQSIFAQVIVEIGFGGGGESAHQSRYGWRYAPTTERRTQRMKLSIVQGSTSKLLQFFVQDSSSSVGAGLTGLTSSTSGLTAYYYLEGAGSATSISLSGGTLGTWSSGGFIVVDGTHLPGVYQLGIPNAALTGAKSVVIMLMGAANMAPVLMEIELTAVNNQDAVRFGLSSLPNGSMEVKKNQALNNFAFLMVSNVNHITPETGLTVTATRSIDGGAFSACANSVTEVGNGIYVINLATTDLNGGVITLLFTATGADNRYVSIVTQP